MSDFLLNKTKIKMTQVSELGSTQILSPSIMLTDIIITNNSNGSATLIATDEFNHTHIICSLKANECFNHAFTGGWVFWDRAAIQLVKEVEDGVVDVSVGYIKVTGQNYYVWRQE